MIVSSYLDRPVRSIASAIRDLETRLPHVGDDGERHRIEQALRALRNELARLGDRE